MSGPTQRTLVLDESLPNRLAREMGLRGRNTVAVSALGLRGSLDPELLRRLNAQIDDWVLISADDALPEEHADAVAAVRATIAVVHPVREHGWDLDSWRREIVHRWAHVIHDQDGGTVRRYGLRRHGLWRPRLRRSAVA